jgi:hypothetical protein
VSGAPRELAGGAALAGATAKKEKARNNGRTLIFILLPSKIVLLRVRFIIDRS